MAQVYRICPNGHAIYSSGKVRFCARGSGCFHEITRGKYKHEYYYEYMKNESCCFCMANNIDGNLRVNGRKWL